MSSREKNGTERSRNSGKVGPATTETRKQARGSQLGKREELLTELGMRDGWIGSAQIEGKTATPDGNGDVAGEIRKSSAVHARNSEPN